ncbi:MAG: beta-L-arabinofuranosidase domain-containing protein [Pirellulaceae bacterium]
MTILRRRSRLYSLAFTTTLLAVVGMGGAASAAPPTLRARPFALADVRLLPGPFKEGEEIAVKYLLSFEPDRLLANFRKEAGLQPKAEHYGGWESQGVSGHSAGHYLSACAMAYAATGDQRFLDRINYMVDELAACQEALGTGYVAAIPDGKRVYAEVAAGNIRSAGFDLNGCWVPNYTLHKLLAGLRDAYRHCGNEKALHVEKKLADWFEKTLQGLDQSQIQKMLMAEHGGINETFADLYADTGDPRYLTLSRRFHHKAILDPLAEGVDILPGKHANTQIPKLIGLARRYELAGEEQDRAAAEFFWDRVVHHHSYVTGGHCDHEHFGEPGKLNDRLSTNTTETCNVYNMLKLTALLFGWKPEADVADFYERALLNHIRATQHPDGRVIYNLSLKPGHHKEYLSTDSFTCCGGTGFENHVKYNEAIYYHNTDELWVNLFIASEVQWRERGITLRQKTQWPRADSTSLTLECDQPQEFTLHVRHPYWAIRGLTISVNEQPVEVGTTASSYASIRRTWKNGDRIQVTFLMSLRTEAMPDNPNRIAMFFGPTLLAAVLGPVDDPAADTPSYVPVLITDGKPVEEWVKSVDAESAEFATVGVGKPRDVTLVPFHSLHDRRYSVYLDIFTRAQWAEKEVELQAQQERERQLAARTVDILRIGEMQPERDHQLSGERTGAGEHRGRKWRHATDGGWFAFEISVDGEGSNELLCTYWGSETGQRTFDILVDGQKIAEQSLRNDRPNQFFDVCYPIPAELTKGKQRVTVRLQAHPNNFAGGLFGCRILRAE